MAEINGWRGLQNLAERKTGRIVVSVAERWRCCSKPVTGHLWWRLNILSDCAPISTSHSSFERTKRTDSDGHSDNCAFSKSC